MGSVFGAVSNMSTGEYTLDQNEGKDKCFKPQPFL